ncbi:tRNA-dihydrouridine(16/17) synthase [NAD(P)(+)], partial [Cucumispora dikerogammari]
MKNDEKHVLERFHKTENDSLFIKRHDSENINIQHTSPDEKKTFENITKGKFLCLAPMVNNSSRPYRLLARSLGANLVYTEMINCESYLRGQNRKSLLDSFPITESLRSSISDCFGAFYDHCNSKEIYDLIVQICGNSLPAILKCVDSILNETSSRIFSIDLNLGCPQKIAKKGNYGAFLAEDTKLTYSLVSSIA